jgi:transcriptional regulator with XRE-family HTH domain
MTTAAFDHHALRERREQRGLSQAALGAALGVTNKAVSEWERGKNYPQIGIQPRLATALDCSIDDLFSIPQPAGTPT